MAPGFAPHGEEVQLAAAQLHESLHDLLVEDAEGEDWATVPFLRLQLTFAEVDHIRDLNDADGARAVLDISRVSEIEESAKRLFGLGRVEPNAPLGHLVEAWRQRRPEASTGWIDELAGQVKDGSHWAYPRFRWQLMSSVDRADRAKYAPILSRVRSVPRKRVHEFDVYFSKFDTDDEGALRIAFVDEPQVQPAAVSRVVSAES